MPILTCIYFTFNWLNLTSEMHFVKFHPEVASSLLSRGKRKYAPLGMRLLWKYINYFLVYHQDCRQTHSPGWAKVRTFPQLFLIFLNILLIFPQFALNFFLILVLRVGDSPTREGPGYATVYILFHTFCYISITTKNLKLKFWICNEENMGFHLISKNILLVVDPWGLRMWCC